MGPNKDVEWQEGYLSGMHLQVRNIEVDSLGNPIEPTELYRFGKHTPTGKYVIIKKGVEIHDFTFMN